MHATVSCNLLYERRDCIFARGLSLFHLISGVVVIHKLLPLPLALICNNDPENYNHLNHQLSRILRLPAGFHESITGTDCGICATCSCIRQRVVFHAEESALGVRLCQKVLTKTNLSSAQ